MYVYIYIYMYISKLIIHNVYAFTLGLPTSTRSRCVFFPSGDNSDAQPIGDVVGIGQSLESPESAATSEDVDGNKDLYRSMICEDHEHVYITSVLYIYIYI